MAQDTQVKNEQSKTVPTEQSANVSIDTMRSELAAAQRQIAQLSSALEAAQSDARQSRPSVERTRIGTLQSAVKLLQSDGMVECFGTASESATDEDATASIATYAALIRTNATDAIAFADSLVSESADMPLTLIRRFVKLANPARATATK